MGSYWRADASSVKFHCCFLMSEFNYYLDICDCLKGQTVGAKPVLICAEDPIIQPLLSPSRERVTVEQQICTAGHIWPASALAPELPGNLQPLQIWLISTCLFPPAKVKPGVMERRVPKVKKVFLDSFPHQFQPAQPTILQRWFKSADLQPRKWRLGVLKALKASTRCLGCAQSNAELLDDCSRANVSISTVSKQVISV